MATADHDDFLGIWELLPDTCQFEQGDPPRAGTYRIEQTDDGAVRFTATEGGTRVDIQHRRGALSEERWSGTNARYRASWEQVLASIAAGGWQAEA